MLLRKNTPLVDNKEYGRFSNILNIVFMNRWGLKTPQKFNPVANMQKLLMKALIFQTWIQVSFSADGAKCFTRRCKK